MQPQLEGTAAPTEAAKAAPPQATPPAPAAPRKVTSPAHFWRRPAAVQLNAPSQELQDLKDRYIAWMIATRYAEETMQHAHSAIEWLFKYLGMRGISRVADVTPGVLDGYSLWLHERPKAFHDGKLIGMRTIFYRLIGVKWFFEWLAQNMLILSDPAENLELPQIKQGLPQVILTQEEARRLLDAPDLRSPVGYRDKALLELVYATGIRTAEMFNLTVADFDAKARTIFVREGKGHKDRILPLPSVVAGYLKEYVEKVRPKFVRNAKLPDDAMFVSWRGKRLRRTDLCFLFRRCGRAAGLEAKRPTPMILRHSIASHLLENGMDIRYIQEFLGHERLSTTQIYAKVTLSGLRKHYNKHHPKEKRVRKIEMEAAG
jgi:integrase/recombinase XerD